MSIYIWMCVITLIGLLSYNEHVKKDGDKVTTTELVWMTILSPAFIAVCIGILAAEMENEK